MANTDPAKLSKSQNIKLLRYKNLAAVCALHGLPVALLPKLARAVRHLRATLVGLDQVIATRLPTDASKRAAADHKQLIAAAFDAVARVIRDELEPELGFVADAAPQFYGEIRAALAKPPPPPVPEAAAPHPRPPAQGGG